MKEKEKRSQRNSSCRCQISTKCAICKKDLQAESASHKVRTEAFRDLIVREYGVEIFPVWRKLCCAHFSPHYHYHHKIYTTEHTYVSDSSDVLKTGLDASPYWSDSASIRKSKEVQSSLPYFRDNQPHLGSQKAGYCIYQQRSNLL